MRRIATAGLVVLATFACGGPEPVEEPPPPPPPRMTVPTEILRPFRLGQIARMHALNLIYLSSQPRPADLEEARDEGLVTVVDLRHPDEIEMDERAVVEELGMTYVSLAWNGPDELTDDVFREARRMFSEAERPVLVHGSSGNRVAAVWIPWRVLEGGLTWSQARGETAKIGMVTPAYEALARDYVERNGYRDF